MQRGRYPDCGPSRASHSFRLGLLAQDGSSRVYKGHVLSGGGGGEEQRTWGGEILTHFEQQGDDIGDLLLELTAWVPVYLIFCFLLEGRA